MPEQSWQPYNQACLDYLIQTDSQKNVLGFACLTSQGALNGQHVRHLSPHKASQVNPRLDLLLSSGPKLSLLKGAYHLSALDVRLQTKKPNYTFWLCMRFLSGPLQLSVQLRPRRRLRITASIVFFGHCSTAIGRLNFLGGLERGIWELLPVWGCEIGETPSDRAS